VIGTAVEVDECLACPDRSRQRIAITLDYGQTGVVCGLAQIGKYLKDEEILGAAKRVADFVARHAVPERGGYKLPKAVLFKLGGRETCTSFVMVSRDVTENRPSRTFFSATWPSACALPSRAHNQTNCGLRAHSKRLIARVPFDCPH